MAKLQFHNVWNHAKQDRLVSNIPAYKFQILYRISKCKGYTEAKQADGSLKVSHCTEPHYQWRGEFADGSFTQYFDIEPAHFKSWEKRTETDKARPEAQLVSEYTEQMCKSPEQFGQYLKRVTKSIQRWEWQKNRRLET